MTKSISKNRKARHDYEIEETLETGICLKGSEIKALRDGRGSISESYAVIKDDEAWLLNMYIPALKEASYHNHVERRDRKLLLHKKEIEKWEVASRQKGYTLIPLELYFNKRNYVKLRLALGRGKTKYDKRESEKEKDMKKEAQRATRK